MHIIGKPIAVCFIAVNPEAVGRRPAMARNRRNQGRGDQGRGSQGADRPWRWIFSMVSLTLQDHKLLMFFLGKMITWMILVEFCF